MTAPDGGPARPRRVASGLTFHRLGELAVTEPDWLVRDFIESDSLALLVGDPGTGKSLLALDLASCIATGTEWHGYKVKSGAVLYIAGEGLRGILRRREAWTIQHGLALDRAPLFISKEPTQLTNLTSQDWLLSVIGRFITEHGRPELIIVDTLARNFGPGDENSTSDMNAAVLACDALRIRTGAAVLVLHHSGHADKNRGRGSGVLRGAVDTELLLTRYSDGATTVTSTKTKDAECVPDFAFQIVSVDIGLRDADQRAVTAPALKRLDYLPSARRAVATGKNQLGAQRALRRLLREAGAAPVTVEQWQTATGLRPNRFKEVRDSLVDAGHVRIEDGCVESSERSGSSELGSDRATSTSEFGRSSDSTIVTSESSRLSILR